MAQAKTLALMPRPKAGVSPFGRVNLQQGASAMVTRAKAAMAKIRARQDELKETVIVGGATILGGGLGGFLTGMRAGMGIGDIPGTDIDATWAIGTALIVGSALMPPGSWRTGVQSSGVGVLAYMLGTAVNRWASERPPTP